MAIHSAEKIINIILQLFDFSSIRHAKVIFSRFIIVLNKRCLLMFHIQQM